MRVITEKTFQRDFDTVMDSVMEKKKTFMVIASNKKNYLLLPYNYYQQIQGELTQLVE